MRLVVEREPIDKRIKSLKEQLKKIPNHLKTDLFALSEQQSGAESDEWAI